MKLDRLKGLYSRIDTDVSMDHRIKNRLLYHNNVKETFDQSQYGERYERGEQGSAISRIRRFKPILSSLLVLMLIAVVLMGIRANLFNKSEEQANDFTASAAPDTDSDGLASLLNKFFVEDPKKPVEEESLTGDPKGDTDTKEVIDDLIVSENNSLSEQLENEPTELMEDGKETQENNTAEMKEEATKVNEKTDKLEEMAAGDFYFAHFDVMTEGFVKASIPSLVIRLHGNVDSINPDDLTEVVLTKDGVPVDNNITANSRRVQFTWGYEEVTDFYFDFAYSNIEPGNYNLTGKYQGIPFDVYNKIVETELTDEPADEKALRSISWVYKPDKDGTPMMLAELSFYFEGLQNSFDVSDLSDIKVTLDGTELPIAFEEGIYRYYEVNTDNSGDTSFSLILKEALTASGTYIVTGSYRGVPFTSMEIVIN